MIIQVGHLEKENQTENKRFLTKKALSIDDRSLPKQGFVGQRRLNSCQQRCSVSNQHR